ncbi:ribosome small subunit-dependent GTPase A [Plantactinospora sp. KBS50]|uniref:ribosome small subunit-dependent GTPase A n=1 Tax=Plantactinospora sp. KBS50 TaxID=2024580 RepID=UPI0012FE0984|nr:ribosome small subunit-dependent GTPase A [Plantactinospora sp. KBS50]
MERKSCVLATPDGPRTVPTTIGVAVGDWALLDDAGQVSGIQPRSTEIRRLGVGGRAVEQVLAANLDIVAVCAPLERDARLGRVERLLALAWASGAQPLLVATKIDLCRPEDVGPALSQFGAAAPGVDVVPVTVTDLTSLDPVRAMIAPDRTLVAIGASGAGKSTLINGLVGGMELATGAVRESDGKGRHTTAWRELVELPGGGYLIDTPGLRAVGLSDAAEGVDAAYADITDLAAQCRFSDCGHESEPGCAVRAAIERGEIDAGRLERHRKLQRELAFQARRFDARARSEERKRWAKLSRNSNPARP